MEPVITFAALSLIIRIKTVVIGVRDIISSEEEARSMRRQMRYFVASIDEVDRLIRRVRDLIPGKLHRIISDLTRYCRNCSKAASHFYYKFQTKRCVRLFNWMAMSLGQNQISIYQGQVHDCEDWLNVALTTLSLWVSNEIRRISARNLTEDLTEDVLEGQREARCRHQLRQHLNRAKCRANRKRYRKMEKAGIDLRGLERLAEEILDDPVTETASSAASTSQGQRNNRYRYQHNPNISSQPWTRSDLPRVVPVLSRENEHGRRSSSLSRPELNPVYDHSLTEHQHPPIVTNIPPPPRNDYQNPGAEPQTSVQSSAPSAGPYTSFVHRSSSSQIPHSFIDICPPISIPNQERQDRRQRKSSRSSSTSYHSEFDHRSSTFQAPHVIADTHSLISRGPAQERLERRQRRSSRSSSTSHHSDFDHRSSRIYAPYVIMDSRPPISNAPDQEPRRRYQEPSTRSSSLSHDSGFVDGPPRLRRSHISIGIHPPISYNRDQERRGRQQNTSSRRPSISKNSGLVDGSPGLRRSHVIRDSRPPISNDPEQKRSRRH